MRITLVKLDTKHTHIYEAMLNEIKFMNIFPETIAVSQSLNDNAQVKYC